VSTKSERGEQARARARVLGAKLFSERGYSDTTTRELAAAMDVTNGTFYYYFASKEDLLYEISLHALEEVTNAATSAVERLTDPKVRVQKLIDAHMRTILGSPDSHKTVLELSWRSLTGEKRDQVIDARGAYEALLRSEIMAAQAAGVLRRDSDARTLTLLLLNLMNWTIFWYRPGPGSMEQVIAEIERLFLEGAGVH
jgi:AcrR family transcriptional regulator